MASETMTVKEAAARVGLGLTSVYELVEKGTIPSRKIGPSQRKIVLDAIDVEAYWDSSKVGEKQSEPSLAFRHVRPQSRNLRSR